MSLQRAQNLFLRLCRAAVSEDPEVREQARDALEKAIEEPDMPREPVKPVLKEDLQKVMGVFEDYEVGGDKGRLKRILQRMRGKIRNLAKKLARNEVIRKVRKAAAKVVKPIGRAGARLASQALGLLGVPPRATEEVLRRGGRAAARAVRRRAGPRLERLVNKAKHGQVGEVLDEIGEAEDEYFDELLRDQEAFG